MAAISHIYDVRFDAVLITVFPLPAVCFTIEDFLRFAHGLISEYISEDLSKALLKHLQ